VAHPERIIGVRGFNSWALEPSESVTIIFHSRMEPNGLGCDSDGGRSCQLVSLPSADFAHWSRMGFNDAGH
jgi:hypothetical protein